MSEPNTQYTVLARRCRPQSFDEVVGQEHVGQAIQNAIRTGRVAHAYLFTGARGVGKTSTARIFAKALNCPHVRDGIPCNQCEICHGIGAGNDVDVLEIDGASNRGIDDIRQLRANVSVRSMRSPYKVYIIDEVHMLTKEAFNALLKTLEEPPPNVKFVFCTTEPNKVPDTILSRCQRFDFGTISQDGIAGRLRQIALSEGKDVDDEAVELVARRAAGSMRDSQSLFDQLLAFGGDHITAADVHQLLGTATDDRLIDLVESLIGNQPAEALLAIEAALQQGVQIGNLSDQLLAYLRDLLVTAAGAKDVALSAVTDASRDRVADQARRWGLQTISAAMQILAETKSRMQRASFGRALVELAVVRMASLEQLDQIALLIATSGTAGPRPVSGGANRGPDAALKKNDNRPVPVAPPKVSLPVSTAPPIHTDPPLAETETLPAPDSSSSMIAKEEPQLVSDTKLVDESLGEFWERLLGELPEKLAEHLKNASKRAIIGPNRLEILFPKSYSFSKAYCESGDAPKRLAAAAQKIVGELVDCRVAIDATTEPATKPASRPETSRLGERRRVSTMESDTFVQMAVTVFGGQVVDVRPLPPEAIVSSHSEGMESNEDEN